MCTTCQELMEKEIQLPTVEAVKMGHAEIIKGHKLEHGVFEEIPSWLKIAIESGKVKISDNRERDYATLLVETAEGKVECLPGNWIVKDTTGKLHVSTICLQKP